MPRHPFLAGLAAASASTASVMAATGMIVALVESPFAVMHPAALLLFLIVFVVALLHVLALGLPVYAILPAERRASIWTNLGASFLIGATPLPILIMLFALSSGLESASSDGVQTWVDGHPTIYFFLEFLPMAAVLGAFGMAGGYTFWWILRERGTGVG